MLTGEPPRTRYDAEFPLLGIPVRVHPLFWLIAVVLGALAAQGSESPRLAISVVMVWIMIVFVSVLVHEFGHALLMRYFGQGSRVVLHAMGGLAIPDASAGGNPWNRPKSTPWQQIAISAAGPGAGFALAAIVVALSIAAGGQLIPVRILNGVVPYFFIVGVGDRFADPFVGAIIDETIRASLWVNIGWGIINLFPVFPLDGGQISRQLFSLNDPYKGLEQSLWLSVFCGGGLAILGVMSGRIFLMFLFGSLAFQSYQALQQMRGGGGGYGGNPW